MYQGDKMIKNNYKGMAFIMAAIFAGSGSALASEVYIEQAGSSSTFNITQSNGSNRVGSENTPSVFSGSSILVDIVQDGTLNEADLSVITATDTVIDYTATGGSNILEVDIANSGNSLTVVKTGDANRVTMCGTNDGAGAVAGATASCSTAVGVVDTTNVINITGDSNSVNLALASANASNTVNIGQNTISDNNVVNITQSGAGVHTTAITVDGNTNLVNVTQQ
jgi:selenophosphate synthase